MRNAFGSIVFLATLIAVGCGEGQFGAGSGSEKIQPARSTTNPSVEGADGSGAHPSDQNATDQASAEKGNHKGADDGTAKDDGKDGPNGKDEKLDLTKLDKTPDGQVIAQCLKEWRNAEFTQADIDNYRIVEAGAQSLGGSWTEDGGRGNGKEIVLVKGKASTLGGLNLKLTNPEGFYCLDLGAGTLGSVRIQIECDARVGNQKVLSGSLGAVNMSRMNCN